MTRPTRAFRMAFPIIKYLTLNPDKTAYTVAKNAKIDIPTTYKTMEILVEAHFVKVRPEGKHTTGLLKESYSVTPQGIVALLQAHPEYAQISKSDVRNMAEKQTSFLPVVFGKWEMFCQKKVEDIAYKYLMIAVQHTEDEVERLSDVAEGREPRKSFAASGPMHRHDIYETFLLRAPMFRTSEAEEWAGLVRNDPELRTMAEKEISRLRGEAQEGVNYWDDALKELHGEPHGEVSLVSANPEEDEIWDSFHELWKYSRAEALDEGRPLPSPGEVMGELIKRENIRSRKKRKTSSTSPFST